MSQHPNHEHDHDCEHEHKHAEHLELEIVKEITSLPDRPLTNDEFRDLQHLDVFDSVHTGDHSHKIDVLFVNDTDQEYWIQYFSADHACVTRTDGSVSLDSSGWYQYRKVQEEEGADL